jgi:hypothetical protein
MQSPKVKRKRKIHNTIDPLNIQAESLKVMDLYSFHVNPVSLSSLLEMISSFSF